MKTAAHAVLSPYAVYLYLYMYRCGCTYRVTLSVQLRNTTTYGSREVPLRSTIATAEMFGYI